MKKISQSYLGKFELFFNTGSVISVVALPMSEAPATYVFSPETVLQNKLHYVKVVK